jgi:hypothetical protein
MVKKVFSSSGRWAGFGIREPFQILSQSNFKFISVFALTLSQMSTMLNPLVTGEGMHRVVSDVLFFDGVVGFGEEIFGEMNFKLADNHPFFA